MTPPANTATLRHTPSARQTRRSQIQKIQFSFSHFPISYQSMIPSYLNQSQSLTSLDYTYAWSKLQCWAPAYTIHILTAYVTIAAGFLAFITRLHPRLHLWHIWMGRLYLVGMLWSMSASLLIFNTGLPVGVVISFLWVMTGLTVVCMQINKFIQI